MAGNKSLEIAFTQLAEEIRFWKSFFIIKQ